MIPSQVMGAGSSAMQTTAIVGGCSTGLTALGTNQATALQLPEANNSITSAAASTGFKLPKIEAGSEIWVRNDGGNAITAYPFETSGVTIQGAATFGLGNTKTVCFKAMSSTNWVALLSG